MLAEFHQAAKLTAVFAEHGRVKVLALLVLNECLNGLADCGGAVGLHRFTNCLIGELDFPFDPFGTGPGLFFGCAAILFPAVRPAEMFPAIAALIKLVSGVLAIEGVADK